MNMRYYLWTVIVTVLLSTPIHADIVRYTTGFEPSPASPAFTLGNIVGQDSWEKFSTDLGNRSVASISIASGVTGNATQVVKFQNLVAGQTGAGEATYAFRVLSPAVSPLTDGNPQIKIKWDMRVASGGTQTGEWGVSAYDTNVNLIAGVAFGTGLTGDILEGTGPDTDPNATLGYISNFGPAPAKDSWHTYVLALDFQTGGYRLDVDNVVRGFGPLTLVHNNLLSDADFVANFRGTDTAYFDNFSITSTTGIIPEPSCGLVLVGSALALLRRRLRVA